MTKLIKLSKIGEQRFKSLQIPLEAIMKKEHIKASREEEGLLLFSIQEWSRLFKAMAQYMSNDLIGFSLGHVEQVSQFDAASIAAVHSIDVTQAFQKLAKYKKLTCPEQIAVSQEEFGLVISFGWNNDSPVESVLRDAFFATVLSILRIGTGERQVPLKVFVTEDFISKDYKDYWEGLGCSNIVEKAPVDRLVFPKELGDRLMVTYNPDLLTLLTPMLDSRLGKEHTDIGKPSELVQRVRQALLKMMNGDAYTIETIAEHLHMSRRTLQRKLAAENITYQEILDAVRLDVSKGLLEKTDMSLGEITFYIGFEEKNSFIRFFQKQTGTSPMEWRKEYGDK